MPGYEPNRSLAQLDSAIPSGESGRELEASLRYVDKQWEVMDEIIRLGLQINHERIVNRERCDNDL